MGIFEQYGMVIIVLVIILFFTWYGYQKGVLRSLIPLISIIVSLLLGQIAAPFISRLVREHTPLYNNLQNRIEEGLTLDTLANNPTLGEQIRQIQGIPVPGLLQGSLLENNNSVIRDMLGVNQFRAYVSAYFSNIILHHLSFFVSFIVIQIIVRIILSALKFKMNIPGFKWANKTLGAIVGFSRGLLIVWIGFILITAFAGTTRGASLLSEITNNAFLSFLYNNNLVSRLVLTMVNHFL